MLNEKKKRSGAIDVVRLVGIVAVVIGHIWTDGLVRPLIYTWHVPLFFVLVGYFWSPNRSVFEEAKNRFRTLVIPAIVWGTAILVIYSAARSMNVEMTISGLLPMPAYMAYWFVPALFFVALLYRSMQRLSYWVPWAVAVAGLIVAYAAGGALANVPFFIGLVFPSLFFVLIGTAARRFRQQLTVVLAIPLLAVAMSAVALGISAPLDMKAGDFGTPVFSVVVAAIISVGLIVLCEALVPRMPPIVSSGATCLALAGWPVILGHAAIILLLRDLGAPAPLLLADRLGRASDSDFPACHWYQTTCSHFGTRSPPQATALTIYECGSAPRSQKRAVKLA